ncbi:MAG: hypothetical protein FXF47_02990 [Candidatus Mcinerneyibacterium aminivorans]|uniref:Uncharacterized protein n=1 Tax=Candidatus Mcinerneyibacterium aminivorans TaxID=2703815 RepID=A0A5D0MEX6_9BACT|nr:MAG: hypothetical protein FXF47_02990 [Candidatus Mcinerneyibacterium aminivorans]
MTAASLAFVKKTNSFKGFINVLGIIEKYIIIHIEDSSEYFGKKYNKNYSEVILVCKKHKTYRNYIFQKHTLEDIK